MVVAIYHCPLYTIIELFSYFKEFLIGILKDAIIGIHTCNMYYIII